MEDGHGSSAFGAAARKDGDVQMWGMGVGGGRGDGVHGGRVRGFACPVVLLLGVLGELLIRVCRNGEGNGARYEQFLCGGDSALEGVYCCDVI